MAITPEPHNDISEVDLERVARHIRTAVEILNGRLPSRRIDVLLHEAQNRVETVRRKVRNRECRNTRTGHIRAWHANTGVAA